MTTEDRVREDRRAARPLEGRSMTVALGRRVMVLGDLLLPPEPSPSSLATCRDIAQRLAEWQGPGIVVVCGQLVAAGCHEEPGPARRLRAHGELTAALSAFAARPDSRVVVVVDPSADSGDLAVELAALGVIGRSPGSTCTA